MKQVKTSQWNVRQVVKMLEKHDVYDKHTEPDIPKKWFVENISETYFKHVYILGQAADSSVNLGMLLHIEEI